jgi:hypothetical protein
LYQVLAIVMADVFISYKHPEDRESVRPIVHALREQGWSVWWCQELLPGQHWDRVIETELNSAKCVIVVWSSCSIGSDEVRTEAAEGRRRKCLIQVSIEGGERPATFAGVQGVDLTHWMGSSADQRFAEVREGVRRILGRSPRKTGVEVERAVKGLILAVKAGYVRATIDDGIQNPTLQDILDRNGAAIRGALRNAIDKAGTQERRMLHSAISTVLVGGEGNRLHGYITELIADAGNSGKGTR